MVGSLASCTDTKNAPTTSPSPSTIVAPSTTTTAPPTRFATIVLVVPASGEREGLGTEAKEGLELALRHGVEDGRLPADMTIKVRVLDESARNLARSVDRVVRESDVVALVGGLSESTEAVLAPIARRRKVALFSFAWRSGSESAEAVRVGPSDDTLIARAASAVTLANPNTFVATIAAAPPTAASMKERDAITNALIGPALSAPHFLEVSTELPPVTPPAGVETGIPADQPLVLVGLGIPLFQEYARIRPQPTNAAPSFVVPLDPLGCGTRPTLLAAGTRCISRGTWLGPDAPSKTFREDAAAAGLTPSWSTTVGYDAGGVVAYLARPIASITEAQELRERLLTAKKPGALAGFSGVNGKLTAEAGFNSDAQVLLARDGKWVSAS